MEKSISWIKQQLEEIIKEHDCSIKKSALSIDIFFQEIDNIPQEIINLIKGLVQREALQAWLDNERNGLIAMATGTGKSKIVVDYLKEFSAIQDNNLIIVPTEKLRDENWMNEFEKWNELPKYQQTKRECYASISSQRLRSSGYQLVVLDEAHNLTENNMEFFANSSVRNIMALTATPPTDPIKIAILERLGIKTVYELNLDTAVKLRIVAPYEIVIVETQLESIDKTAIGGTKNKPFATTEAKLYSHINQTINRIMYANKPEVLKFALLKRMRFIYGLKSKQDAAEYILSTLPNSNRTLIFCGSIDQARALGEGCYHSKTSDKWLTKFNNKEINKLSCVNALNEGMNLVDVDDAIIVQLNSNERHTIQRLGRCVRSREGHKAKIIILVCKGTQDEKWLTKAIENLDTNNIKRVRLVDLKVNNDSI